MKRAFTVAVVGGLMAFLVPQASFADHNAEHKGDCAGQTEGATDSPEQAPPQQHPYGDREQKDSDGGEILF